jgi:hypothetical protein
VQKSVVVRGRQDRRAGRHAEHRSSVTKIDVGIGEPFEHPFDEGINRMTCLGRERGQLSAGRSSSLMLLGMVHLRRYGEDRTGSRACPCRETDLKKT